MQKVSLLVLPPPRLTAYILHPTVTRIEMQPLEPPRLRTHGTSGGLRAFNSKDGQLYSYPTADRARVEARICAGILGPGPLTFEMMVSDKWANEVHALSYRGISRAGFGHYLATASVCAIPHPLVPASNQGTVPLSRTEQIPNIFLDRKSLAYKREELQKYAAQFARKNKLFKPRDLEKIKRDLQADKLKYFGTNFVDVVIVAKPDPSTRNNVSEASSAWMRCTSAPRAK